MKPLDKDGMAQLRHGLIELSNLALFLAELFQDYPELSVIQPETMKDVFPCDLIEWGQRTLTLRNAWNVVLAQEERKQGRCEDCGVLRGRHGQTCPQYRKFIGENQE